LLATPEIRTQIHNQVAEIDIRKSAQRNGMQTLRMDGERWLKEGITSEAELLRVTKD
jgi:general secretion pathway protein E